MKGILPRNFQGALFVTLTFVNAGLASFFAAADAFQLALFSGTTALLCFGVWMNSSPAKKGEISNE